MTDIYLCIHGHFYQPPRENPWLGFIEAQPSARPFHDWNERITRECYAPNLTARLLGQGGRIERLIDNYEYMSFNFGPTLLTWMEKTHPEIYAGIIEADRASRARFEGHGNALAQVYNHMIMPLSTTRDKLTQIRWGRQDFIRRFGREPEGMWLAETAVDHETLTLMAREGIKFTILAPNQAAAIRPLNGEGDAWEDVTGSRIDPRRPYRVLLDESGQTYIDVFFYDGQVSRAIAFEGLLSSGASLLERIKKAAGAVMDRPRLINLATDGESYGHHFRFGDMALAWIFDHLEKNDSLKIINYGSFLDRFPPEYEVEILDNTSWSCAHGIERWRSDCGCRTTFREGWNQAWRAPLRQGLDWLRDRLDEILIERGTVLFKDVWAARDDYINVIYEPTAGTRDAFLARNAAGPLDEVMKSEALALMESQVMGLFMFTSCGWFFDDIAGLEPIQDMKYAARAIDLVRPWSRTDLRTGLLEYMAQGKSNSREYTDGADIYQRQVERSRIEPSMAMAHYALRYLTQKGGLDRCPVARWVSPIRIRPLGGPGMDLVMGLAQVVDERIGRVFTRAFLAMHPVGPNLICYVTVAEDMDFDSLTQKLQPAVQEAATDRISQIFLNIFPQADCHTLADLIPEVELDIVRSLADDVINDFRNRAWEIFNDNQDILSLFVQAGEEVPEIAGLILRLDLSERLDRLLITCQERGGIDWEEVKELSARSKAWNIKLRGPAIAARAKKIIDEGCRNLAALPCPETLGKLEDFLRLAREMDLDLDLWSCQNELSKLLIQKKDGLSDDFKADLKNLGVALGFSI